MAYIQMIAAVIDIIESMLALITQLRTLAQASNAITPEQDAAFASQMNTLFASSAWQPDSASAAEVTDQRLCSGFVTATNADQSDSCNSG